MARRSPLDSMESWLEQMSEQFETAAQRWGTNSGLGTTSFQEPRIDFVEYDDDYRIVADLPGFDSADIDVLVTDHTLSLAAERTTESTVGDGDFIRQERSRSTMERRINLPADADTDDISASIDNGTLEIRIGRTASLSSGNRIDIE